jgi:hypothetical protein
MQFLLFTAVKRRGAIDAAARLIVEVEETLKQKKIVGTLGMDIKGAFPTVNSACLRKKMRKMKLDESLVGWVKGFMEERLVEMVINWDGGKLIGCNTGLPQWSPVSPILFLIYIADLPKVVEKAEENVLSLSFVDDVT